VIKPLGFFANMIPSVCCPSRMFVLLKMLTSTSDNSEIIAIIAIIVITVNNRAIIVNNSAIIVNNSA
jgi:hypothetical protein